jgi:hypothetical protein
MKTTIKIFIFIFLFGCFSTFGQTISFKGGLNYNSEHNLTNQLQTNYKVVLYESKKYKIYFDSALILDYDVFKRVSRNNAITTIKIEF